MRNEVKIMKKRKTQLEHSPFKRKRNMTAPRGSANMQTQVSRDVEIELMEVIRNYNREHQIPKKRGKEQNAPALKHILVDFLNTHCIEQKTFENLYVIMHVSKELECNIIGFVENDVGLDQDIFMYEPLDVNEYNFIYALACFNKENYDFMNLSEVNGAQIFDIALEKRGDFDSVREHLQAKGLNTDDSYFVRFNLNNYLDKLKDGVYVGRNSTYYHEGVIVLIDPADKTNRVYLRIYWSYSRGELDLQADVEDLSVFHMSTSAELSYYVLKEFLDLDREPSREELEKSLERLEELKGSIEEKIVDIKESLSKCD